MTRINPIAHRLGFQSLGATVGCVLLVTLCAEAQDVDTSKLPPPVTDQVDFIRDIKPILDNSCLKCHGTERPKSGFSLVTREAVLKGGNQGVDVTPGNSKESPLIHYVAHLVQGMEMPPEGKGDPLTTEQVSLLRAWIDQGVVWGGEEPGGVQASATPIVGYTFVSGDEAKFRELYWQREGWNGGLAEFEIIDRPTFDSRVRTSGQVLLDDYLVTIEATKNNLGFARFGWQQFRSYYDDSGGHFPLFAPSLFEVDPELSMDRGKAWAEFGLTLPRLPRFILGYEYRYRDGLKSTLQWGPVREDAEMRNIYPAFKDVTEGTHVLKFDVDYAWGNFLVADSFRGEWYDLSSRRVNELGYNVSTGEIALTRARDDQDWFQGANTLRIEGQLTEAIFAAAGYLYSHLDSSAAVDVDTSNASLLDVTTTAPGWHSDSISIERESHVFSVNSSFVPWKPLTLTLGIQGEWTRQEGFGGSSVNLAVPFDPFLIELDPSRFRSDLDQSLFTESAGLRFTAIPFTTLFAEARLQQENLGQYEESEGGLNNFLRDTDTEGDLLDYRFGFNTSPWRRVSLSAHYRSYDRDSDYDTTRKEAFGNAYEGYPGFIRWRELHSEEVQSKLAWQVNRWLKTTLAYQWRNNDYTTATDPVTDQVTSTPGGISPGGDLTAGRYEAHVPTLNLTLTPWQRIYFSGTLAYHNARTVTATQGNESVVPYDGDIYSAIGTLTYNVSTNTDLTASYSYSRGDFEQDHYTEGLPLGIEYAQHGMIFGIKRRLAENKTLGLQYRFYHYNEPSSADHNNFTAHGFFATFNMRLQ